MKDVEQRTRLMVETGDIGLEQGSPWAGKVLLTNTTRRSIAPRLAIGLSNAGFDVSVVCPTPGHPLSKTRAVRQTFNYSGVRPLESLVTAIEATTPLMIIPFDDLGVQHLHELHTCSLKFGTSGINFADLIERSVGPPESYSTVSSRFELMKIACEEGLRVPDTAPVDTLDDLRFWRDGHKFPWVLKADGTWGGSGVRIAVSLERAEQFFSELSSRLGTAEITKKLLMNRDQFWLRPWWNGRVLPIVVQSYIDGRPANCAVVCWEGKVLAGIAVEVVIARGQLGPAKVVSVVDDPEMLIAAKRIARRLRLSGFFGLDFMIERGSNDIYLVEMNPRCTPQCHLQLGKGRDMIEALRAQLSGEALRATPPITDKNMIAYFPQARNLNNGLLESSFQDVPQGEPDLVEALLRPWSERRLLARIFDHLRHHQSQKVASSDHVF